MQDNELMKENHDADHSVSSHQFTEQELVAAFIEKRLTDNLAAFKQHLPDIYQVFKSYQEERFFLIYDSVGNINVFDKKNESLVYDDLVGQVYSNLADYINSPIQRPYVIAAPSGDTPVDEVNYIHSPLIGKIGEYQSYVLLNIFSDKVKKSVGLEGLSRALKNDLSTLFIFSTGPGLDVEKLCLEKNIKNLLIVEPCNDAFYLSLQLVDWVSILNKFVENDQNIHFVFSDEENLTSDLSIKLSSVGRHNVAGSYLYSAFYLPEYKELFKKVKDLLGFSVLNGFGFYDDSRYSLAHTAGNLKSGVPLFSTDRKINKSLGQDRLPVFLTGSGPSLDDEIEFIKKNQNKAIIISCGSSLKPLLANDIIPDYYIEMERTSIVTRFIQDSYDGIEGYFDKLKQITFIAVSQVDPKAFEFFETKGMVLKDVETGSFFTRKVFDRIDLPVLPRLAPTCVHSGFTIAVAMGFRNIFLFGTDMGTTDLNKHHSKHSLYSKVESQESKKLDIKEDGEIYKSNFGDKPVYSSGFYPVSKTNIESIMIGWKGNIGSKLAVYNCSDGAYLEGAEPMPSSEIDFSEFDQELDVRKIARSVFEACFSFKPEISDKELNRHLSGMYNTFDKACDYGKQLIVDIKSIREGFDLIEKFRLDFHSSKVLSDEEAWVYTLFDGTLLYVLSAINSTLLLPADEDVIVKRVNDQFSVLRQFFDDAKHDFREKALVCDDPSRHVKYFG